MIAYNIKFIFLNLFLINYLYLYKIILYKIYFYLFKRTLFDKKSEAKEGFLTHVKINHYMWNYLNFIAYLRYKDPNDYTGIESYISEKLDLEDTTW